MLANAIANARSRAEKARRSLCWFKLSLGYDGIETYWRDFLIASNGVYSALKTGSRATPQDRQWYGKKARERRNDELLSYMHQARNSAEHDVAPLLMEGQEIRGLEAIANGMFYDIIETEETVIGIFNTPDRSAAFANITPPDANLLPITNEFGQTFYPPTVQQGRRLTTDTPLGLGTIYLEYLDSLISDAETRTNPSP